MKMPLIGNWLTIILAPNPACMIFNHDLLWSCSIDIMWWLKCVKIIMKRYQPCLLPAMTHQCRWPREYDDESICWPVDFGIQKIYREKYYILTCSMSCPWSAMAVQLWSGYCFYELKLHPAHMWQWKWPTSPVPYGSIKLHIEWPTIMAHGSCWVGDHTFAKKQFEFALRVCLFPENFCIQPDKSVHITNTVSMWGFMRSLHFDVRVGGSEETLSFNCLMTLYTCNVAFKRNISKSKQWIRINLTRNI